MSPADSHAYRLDDPIYPGLIRPKGFPELPAGWTSEANTFESSDGKLQIFELIHSKKDSPKGHRALVVLHGQGEHCGRYLHVPHYVQSEIDVVYLIDHRGHGRSGGGRGHAEHFHSLYDDVVLGIQRLENRLIKKYGKAEIHLLGHSLGGLISLQTLFLNPNLPILSATVTAPLLRIKAKVPAWKKAMANGLAKVWGSLQIATALDATILSHDPGVVEAYQKDRLVHCKMTPAFYMQLQVEMEAARTRTTGMEMPLQVVVPMGDQLVDADASVGFYEQLKHSDKRLKTFEGFYHEPLNEIGKDQVFADILSWIAAHRAGK
ncbi:lysophospholipase [bacterium]|nr:lysophospholipase [bacterium]